MSDPLYCKLYIDTGETINDLRAALDQHCRILFDGTGVETSLRRNEVFDISAKDETPYDFIRSARFYADIEAPQQAASFQSGVAALVSRLRESGRIVIAACDFEDLIAAETGWNWTKDQPEPPGRLTTPHS